jgi:Domain of unknown function (DUF6249)
MSQVDFVALAGVFFAVGLPIALGFGIAAYALSLRQRQLQAILRERELLIEKGATDLPPLALPSDARKRNGYGNLKWGLILVLLGLAFTLIYLTTGHSGHEGTAFLSLGTICAAIGIALLIFHFLARAYQRGDAAPPAAAAEDA